MAEINQMLRILGRLDNADWIPPALKYLADHKGNYALISRFIKALERLAYSLFLRRAYPTVRIARYGAVLQVISDGEALYAAGSPLNLTADEKVETLQQLEGPIYLFQRIRLPILLRLDELLAAGGATYDFNVISVEHVLPQNPSEHSNWMRLFPDPDTREAWTHRLGNLALLPFRKNAQAGNYDFESKKHAYFAKGGIPPFALTVEILKIPEWTVEVIQQRQRRLVDVLAKAWRLAPNDMI